MKKVIWGVLSTAKIGRERVLPGMKKSSLLEIRAIASRDESRARHTADALGIPRAYGSYEALLADPEIEAIYNPLPNHLHVALTLQAAAAGKHVLCEKSIALTAQEAVQLRAAAQKVLIAEAFMVRFHPQWLRVRELVREGRIGTLRTVQMFFGYNNLDPANGSHPAHGAVSHADQEPIELGPVHAMSATLLPNKSINTTVGCQCVKLVPRINAE